MPPERHRLSHSGHPVLPCAYLLIHLHIKYHTDTTVAVMEPAKSKFNIDSLLERKLAEIGKDQDVNRSPTPTAAQLPANAASASDGIVAAAAAAFSQQQAMIANASEGC